MRQLYSVRNDRLGITFKPANKASPSSKTELMTWLCRALPKSFNASNDRTAHPAGIIFDPGKPARERIASKSAETKYGRNRNKPPNLVRKARGVRSSWRTSAISAAVGRGRSGRSSSRRCGSLAKPSCFKIAATAAGLSGSLSRARQRLISWTERFCFRSAMTCSRKRFCLPGGFRSRPGGRKNSRWGSRRNWWTRIRKLPGV